MTDNNKLKSCIVYIPFFEKIAFYIFSIFWGITALLKLGALWIWNSKKYFALKKRDKPPKCLVDSSLGQHSYIKVKGSKLHYVESGNCDSPLLILLHGFLDCWLGWRHQIPILAPHFRVVAVDLKGFGDSEKPQWRRKYQIEELVSELAELISALGASSCVLVGHDLGALLGWFLLYTHPHLVSRFVSISCPHPNVFWDELPPTAIFNKKFINECQLPIVAEVKMMQDDLAIIDNYLSHLPSQSKSEKVNIETYKYVFSRKLDWTGAINYYRSLALCRIAPGSNRSTVPLLLIVGDSDKSCTLEAAVRSTEMEERLSVRVVSDAGHFPHQQAAASVNRLLLGFLAVLDTRVGSLSASFSEPQPSLVNRMFGALSSTVQYGNQVLESVTKRSPLDGVPYRNPGMNQALTPR